MNCLLKPIITEKSMVSAASGVYTFLVDVSCTKHQIKKEVQDLFSVSVTKLTTTITKPAARRTGRRRLPTSSAPTKIARVWLKSGQTIALFDLQEGK
jgi:large subunit ribosomal protein L23